MTVETFITDHRAVCLSRSIYVPLPVTRLYDTDKDDYKL